MQSLCLTAKALNLMEIKMKLSKFFTSCLLLASTSLFANQEITQGAVEPQQSEIEIDMLKLNKPFLYKIEKPYGNRTIDISYSRERTWSYKWSDRVYDFGFHYGKESLESIGDHWKYKISDEEKIKWILAQKKIKLDKFDAFQRRKFESELGKFVELYDNIVNEYIKVHKPIEKITVKNLYLEPFSDTQYSFDKKTYGLGLSYVEKTLDSFVHRVFNVENCIEGEPIRKCLDYKDRFGIYDYFKKNNITKPDPLQPNKGYYPELNGRGNLHAYLLLPLNEDEAEYWYYNKAHIFVDLYFKKMEGSLKLDYGVIKFMTKDQKVFKFLMAASTFNVNNILEPYGYGSYNMTDEDVNRIYNELVYDINNPKFIKEYKFTFDDIKFKY